MKIYIIQIRIYLFFRFTDKVHGTKTEHSDVATYGGRVHVYIYFWVQFEQSTVAKYGGRIYDYIFFRVHYEQSTVDTYCGIYKLFISHIRFYLFFCFTDEVRGTKTENCDVATYGGRVLGVILKQLKKNEN